MNPADNAARALADGNGLAADAQSKARDLSSAAIDRLFARIDDLGDAFSTLSHDAAALARTEANSLKDELIDEFRIHPLRSLAIAVGVGMTAGLYVRK